MPLNETKENFITAFWHIYKTTPLEKITIASLCQRAGYNRATFYHHFANIYELFEMALTTLLLPIQEKVFQSGDFYVLLTENHLAHFIFEYFKKHDEQIAVLFERQDQYFLVKQIKQTLMEYLQTTRPQSTDPEMLGLLLEYHFAAIFATIGYWFEHKRPFPEEKLLKQLYLISENGVFTRLKEELGRSK